MNAAQSPNFLLVGIANLLWLAVLMVLAFRRGRESRGCTPFWSVLFVLSLISGAIGAFGVVSENPYAQPHGIKLVATFAGCMAGLWVQSVLCLVPWGIGRATRKPYRGDNVVGSGRHETGVE